MAIMQSCCCWRSVRRGSFACAIYSGIYNIMLIGILGLMLYEESQYFAGETLQPKSPSFLEPDFMSPTALKLSIALMISSSCGFFCCFLLVYGLLKDRRLFLLPWIFTAFVSSVVDVAHFIYVTFCGKPPFEPAVAMVLTLAFFLFCLNLYSLLCVISQFQEYCEGRGRAMDDSEYGVPAIRYTVQPTTTATSCLSSRRLTTNNDTKVTAIATPTQSPTALATTLTSEKSPTSGRQTRKHVQFPDEEETSDIQPTRNILETKTTDKIGFDHSSYKSDNCNSHN
ncbi:uncharacterized protein LOC127288686 [Leptopilina boulardi]|uniref:uncharacterized protein LOC127288686 n=1 Tax=Leptopilina boulardi TaxID=63433 RepID=UPI0021F55D06|nr:uncharacterized protein LOC127288686 [Leptopilina boulardi]